jgi:biofilm protein TabA
MLGWTSDETSQPQKRRSVQGQSLMIADAVAHAGAYFGLHPAFPRAFELLARGDVSSLAPGRHPIDGDRLYISIGHDDGRGRDGARLEAHRRYIDIQLTLDGAEEIGWLPLSQCRRPAAPFDEDKDIGFFEDRPETWIALPPGRFAIFFPQDAHAPLAGRGTLKKAIVKIAAAHFSSESPRSRSHP